MLKKNLIRALIVTSLFFVNFILAEEELSDPTETGDYVNQKLNLFAISIDGNKVKYCVINESIMQIGDQIYDHTIKEISHNRVILESIQKKLITLTIN